MQPAASLPQTEGREETERKWGRGTAAERQRGGSEGKRQRWKKNREKKKERAHTHTTGRESWGPKASKVAKGEKWRSDTVNATAKKLLNKAPPRSSGYSVVDGAPRGTAAKELRQIFLQVEYVPLPPPFRSRPHRWAEIQKVVVSGLYREANGRASGVPWGRRRDELNILWH